MNQIDARIKHLHATAEVWARYHITFIPDAGEFIIYDPSETYTSVRFKIGDGKTPLKDLDFYTQDPTDDWSSIDGGEISEYPVKDLTQND